MQCGSNRIWDEAGCFVYEVTQSRILIRSSPSVQDNFNIVQNRYFDPQELVSVDLIRHAREDYTNLYSRDDENSILQSPDGPFLRLSDGSGWILAHQDGLELARRLQVEEAPGKPWTFYADNLPYGIELRRHPVEELQNPHDTNRFSALCGGMQFWPMQKIVCDKKLDRGDSSFYRVQGTCGWVFEQRRGNRNDNSNENRPYKRMMIPGDLVDKGLFAFRVVCANGMHIRKSCHVGNGSNCTNVTVRQGDIVVADILRHSPLDNGNGPFLRLTDGSGWLFQHKHGSRSLLEEVSITSGTFHVKVLAPNGIKLRGQPIDSYYFIDHIRAPVLKQDEVIMCDRKLSSPSGTCFYRKQGTDLWICDKRNGDDPEEILAEILPEERSLLGKTPRNSDDNTFLNTTSNKTPWSPHYVRGNANGINGLEEIDFDPTRKVISYRSAENVIINVYFETRIIGIVTHDNTNQSSRAMDRCQRFHRNCNDAELYALLQDPKSYQRGSHQSNKRARLIPSPINTLLCQDEDQSLGRRESFNSTTTSFGSIESQRNLITPDASLSSGTNVETEQEFDCDDSNVEQETRENLLDCQKEIQNLLYRQGNLLRAIQIHEEEHRKEAQQMKIRTEQVEAFRIQREEEEDQRFRMQGLNQIARRRAEGPPAQDRRRGSIVLENIWVGSIVGCVIGLAVSPICGPSLVQMLGLEDLMAL